MCLSMSFLFYNSVTELHIFYAPLISGFYAPLPPNPHCCCVFNNVIVSILDSVFLLYPSSATGLSHVPIFIPSLHSPTYFLFLYHSFIKSIILLIFSCVFYTLLASIFYFPFPTPFLPHIDRIVASLFQLYLLSPLLYSTLFAMSLLFLSTLFISSLFVSSLNDPSFLSYISLLRSSSSNEG